ncbi:MAG: DUF1631 family protein, partial [Pseudomonadales bacterium]|nr:DUF1631 family protein [Pseudomonadales bacterium]
MSEALEKVQKNAVRSLHQLVQQVIDDCKDIMPIARAGDDVLMDFVTNMHNEFDELRGERVFKREAINFETLTLVPNEELATMVAMEGMVAAARNQHLPNFISFNARLNSLFPEERIDESSNPLDPLQISNAFKDALKRLGLNSDESMKVFRVFNEKVLKKLNAILKVANQELIEHGVIPNMGMETSKQPPVASRSPRQKRKPETIGAFGTVEEDPWDEDIEQPELFNMMQNLLHPGAAAPPSAMPATSQASGGQPAGENGEIVELIDTASLFSDGGSDAAAGSAFQPAQPAQYAVPASMVPQNYAKQPGVMQPFQPRPGEEVKMVDQAQLMEILTNLQKTLEERTIPIAGADQAAAGGARAPVSSGIDLSESLGEMLMEGQVDGV